MMIYKAINYLSCFFQKFCFRIFNRNVKFGKHVHWRRRFTVITEFGGKVMVGDNCFFNNDCSIVAHSFVKIGAGCLFGENVKIYDQNHVFNSQGKTLIKSGFSSNPIFIGDNCWICSNVVITKGVTIGDNCVIGAGVVVTSDVPTGSVVKQSNALEVSSIRYK